MDNFSSDKNKKIIIIKVNPHFNDIKDFIEIINNMIEKNETKNEIIKSFILTVHVQRKVEVEDIYIEKDNFICNKSTKYNNCYQIFIDDLKEKEYSTVKNLILKENIGIEEFLLNYYTNELRNKPDENTALKLTNIILNNPNLLSKSYPFISIIIRNLIDNNLDNFFDNLDKLKKCNNLYISLMNKLNDDVLNEIIINIFDNHFNLYFESITKISNLSEKNSKKYFSKYYKYNEDYEKHAIYILFGENLKLLEKCLNFLDEIYNNFTNNNNIINNEILCKLYLI